MNAQAHKARPDPALIATLHACVRVFDAGFDAPWCLIGSAALAACGFTDVVPADVDVWCGREDAASLHARWAEHAVPDHVPADGERFRSAFARYGHLPMPVEVMGGLELRTAKDWEPLQVQAIIHVEVAGLAVPVPALHEQARILRRFGRAKDLARACLIDAHLTGRAHG
jgi:hypothetical protein